MVTLSSVENLKNRTAVIVVHWGDPACTQAAVRSIQRGVPLTSQHIVVVENGVPSHVSLTEARILSLRENRGYAAGVNAGVQEAIRTGAEYFVVMNNDLLYRPGALEAMLAHVRSHRQRMGCVGAIIDEGDRRPVYGGGRVSWSRGRAHLAFSPVAANVLEYISGAFFLITRACVEDAGGMPEHYFLYWEDVAYGWIIRRKGWVLSAARTPILLHPRSQGVRDARLKTYYLVRNGALFVREYAPPAARRWLTSLEPAREAWARRRGRWEIVRALRDARAGVTGALLSGVDLRLPPP